MFILKTLIKAVVLPPGFFIAMAFAGLMIIGRLLFLPHTGYDNLLC